MSYSTLKFDISDGIATITLNRPDAGNALNPKMAKELSQISIVCQEAPEVRAVVLAADGRMFCAGGDLTAFREAGDGVSAMSLEMTGDLHLAISRLTSLNAPLIASVNGSAAGAGLSLVAACDLVICVDSAKFTMAYTGAGLSPDGSASYFLPRRIGDGRARELMLTNRVLSAQEALDWGLVNRVVPADELESATRGLAATIAHGATRAFGKVKSLLKVSLSNGLETQMELESRAIAEMLKSPDAQEGMLAFSEKRKPEFNGR